MNSEVNLSSHLDPSHPGRGWTASQLEATELRTAWAVRPIGQLGTTGFHPRPWTVVFVKAGDGDTAIRRALHILNKV